MYSKVEFFFYLNFTVTEPTIVIKIPVSVINVATLVSSVNIPAIPKPISVVSKARLDKKLNTLPSIWGGNLGLNISIKWCR